MKNELTSTAQRRHDLDWLRVIAFGILIYFHAAVAFLPSAIPLTINAESSPSLSLVVGFLHEFRLGLLFFVSGCGVYFALRKRDRRSFLRERSIRLLGPLAFGILVLVPLMVFLEKQFIGQEFASFWEFYASYFISGVYPTGHLSWHHFWFLVYLYLFCVISGPGFRALQQNSALIDDSIERYRLDSHGLYLLILPLLLVELVLRPFFPGFPNLISDWANFGHWWIIFIAGFLFALDRRLLVAARQIRVTSISLAVCTSFILFDQFWVAEKAYLYPFVDDQQSILNFALFSVLKASNAWLWILSCVGFAARYLNRPSKWLTQLNQAVYPVFCLHLPVLVLLEFFILPTDWSVALKFTLITSFAILILAVLYCVIKPFTIFKYLLGSKPSISTKSSGVASSVQKSEDVGV